MAKTENMTGTIAAFFENSSNARQAVEALHNAGFNSAHIGVAHRWSGSTSGTGASTTTLGTTSSRSESRKHDFSTWDKVKNWFSGDEPEPYENELPRGDLRGREVVDPDAGSGYRSSDLQGSFRNLDIPEEHSRYFSHRLGTSANGAVVTVNAGTRRTEAESILTQYGGDLATGAASDDYGSTEATRLSSADAAPATDTYREEAPENIQLLGEVLRVHKDRINRGEVRIRKEVITENQTVQVPVTREELVIERRPGRETVGPAGTIGETEVRVPLTEERASLDKSTVVREEVSVSKRPVEEVRDVTGEVRREDLVVEDPTRTEDRKQDPNRRVA